MQAMLVVRDQNMRLALELYLHEEPGVVVTAAVAGAADALALLESTRPDLLIMKWVPGDDDCRRLAQAALAGETTVGLIVLYADGTSRDEARAAGAVEVVSSDDPPAGLTRLIRHLRVAQRSGRESRTESGIPF